MESTQRRHILLFNETAVPSYDRPYRCQVYISHLYQHYDRIDIVAPQNKDHFPAEIETKIHYFTYKYRFKKQYSLFQRLLGLANLYVALWRYVSRENPGYIRGEQTHMGLLLQLIPWKRHIPFISSIYDIYYDLYKSFGYPFAWFVCPIIKFLERIGLRRVDLLFVDTPVQRDLMAGLGVSAEQCVTIPNGIYINRFPVSEMKDQKLLEQYGLEGKKVVMYAGDISMIDGLETLIDASPRIVGEIPNVQFVVIGKGLPHYVESLKQRIQKIGLMERFTFIGWLPYEDLYKYINLADVGVAPFLLTPTADTAECGKIIIYLSQRKPVVATKSRGVHALYGDYLKYSEPGDANLLVAQVVDALRHEPTEEQKNKYRQLAELFDNPLVTEYEHNVITAFLDDPKQDMRKYDYLPARLANG
ncbi:MAG: glycosyltransferase [bacterium]